MYISRTRTLVKTVIYRCWVLISTWCMLVITGQTYTDAVLPAIVMNVIWTCSYYLYDRLWMRIPWGIEK